jgi:hypothetical protein
MPQGMGALLPRSDRIVTESLIFLQNSSIDTGGNRSRTDRTPTIAPLFKAPKDTDERLRHEMTDRNHLSSVMRCWESVQWDHRQPDR